MDKKEAIEVLKVGRPCAEGRLSDAIDIAIAAIKESMVQNPATNSDYAAALKVVSEFRRSSSGNKGLWQLQTWCEKRLHAEEQHDA